MINIRYPFSDKLLRVYNPIYEQDVRDAMMPRFIPNPSSAFYVKFQKDDISNFIESVKTDREIK